jgi:hypothetical protein
MNATVDKALLELARLQGDFLYYAPRCLKIKAKDKRIVPLVLNRAQLYVHEQLEEQRQRTGKVRALVLKARQQGFSTYIGGRYYHKTSMNHGTNTYILTHEQGATDNLFAMVGRYHDHSPLKPETGKANAKELYFPKLDGGYAVGTAGSKAVGRSKTVFLFHGSECAFWPNASDHFAGVVQAIPDLPGTEIILESTANGIGGEFHERWQQAEAGIGDYIAIFVPWFWSDEYRRPVPEKFQLSHERGADGEPSEVEYMEMYDLDLSQMAWRRYKIDELKDPQLFMQEYPASAAEAFQTTGHDSFIKPADVLRARKAKLDPTGPLVLGVDPSRLGKDRFSVAWRQGRVCTKKESKAKLDNVAGATYVKSIIDRDHPDKVFIDVGGQGAGVLDILNSWGAPYSKICVAVNFGGEPLEADYIMSDGSVRPGPKNRRAEMWHNLREWLKQVGGADVPDSDSLQADLCGPGYKYDTQQRFLLESKESMLKRGVRSPDEGDALALTFAAPVYDRVPEGVVASRSQANRVARVVRSRATGWMGL